MYSFAGSLNTYTTGITLRNSWKASIFVEKKNVYLGIYKKEKDAAKVRGWLGWTFMRSALRISKFNFNPDIPG